MRVVLLAVTLALFLVLAGFFSVYADRGPKAVYAGYFGEDAVKVGSVLHFLNSDEDVQALVFLTDAERAHMADVRRVINGFKIAFVVLGALLIAQLMAVTTGKQPKELRTRTTTKDGFTLHYSSSGGLRKALLWGGLGAIAIAALLAVASLLDFTWFWSGPFHGLLFPQGNWQFPYDSALITLFPQAFFEGFARQVLFAIATFGLLLILAGRVQKRD